MRSTLFLSPFSPFLSWNPPHSFHSETHFVLFLLEITSFVSSWVQPRSSHVGTRHIPFMLEHGTHPPRSFHLGIDHAPCLLFLFWPDNCLLQYISESLSICRSRRSTCLRHYDHAAINIVFVRCHPFDSGRWALRSGFGTAFNLFSDIQRRNTNALLCAITMTLTIGIWFT